MKYLKQMPRPDTEEADIEHTSETFNTRIPHLTVNKYGSSSQVLYMKLFKV